MTFLNPAILWGLLAVSIPIIIHIFNLKKTKKIEFSTLMFLKEIQQSKYKKIKLKQLLILLCRIAFIILLVMAFSRPFETGYLGTDQKARSSVLLVLDNSFSMLSRELQGTNFDITKRKLMETSELLGENDEVFFATISGIDKPGGVSLFKDRSELKDSVSSARISDITRYLSEVLFYAERIMASSSNLNREIYLFTDGQRSFAKGLSSVPLKLQPDEFTHVNIILTGEREGNNISLDTINTVTKIFEKNRNVKLKCTINNRNNFNVSNKSVLLNYADGRIRDEKVIDIPANSSVDVEFNFLPEVSGYSGGYVEVVQSEVSDDEIPNDNKRFFAFHIPSKVRLLFLSRSQDEMQFVRLALQSSEEMMRDSLNREVRYFEIRQSDAGSISNENLGSYDCVVLTDYPAFTSTDADKLYDYVQQGGGLLIYAGENIDIGNYNNVLLSRFELPAINGTFNSSAEQSFIFEVIDFSHPIFEGIFKGSQPESGNLKKESPKINSGLILLSGLNTQTLIKLNNERSFLNEYTSGKGKILFFCVPPDLSNSDYPVSSLFSPLTVRSILYLSHANQMKEAVTGRDYFTGISASVSQDDGDLIVSNYNSKMKLELAPSAGALVNFKPYLDRVSNFSILREHETLTEFPCNFDNNESSTGKADSKEIGKLAENSLGIALNIIPASGSVNNAVLTLRRGSEIWHLFLAAALLFLALEYIISRSMTRIPK